MALYGGIVVVQIVELDLYHLDVRIVGEDLLQHLGGVVEGDAHMAHLALRLQPERRLVGMALPEMGIVPRPLRVHQIKVEVFHAAGRQLALKEGPDVRLGLEEVGRQLVRQDVALPGIAAGETLPQRRLALALQIAVGGVEIVEARVQKGVHHLFRLRDVHVLAVHRQPHAAEAEVLPDMLHVRSPFSVTRRRAVFDQTIPHPGGSCNAFSAGMLYFPDRYGIISPKTPVHWKGAPRHGTHRTPLPRPRRL